MTNVRHSIERLVFGLQAARSVRGALTKRGFGLRRDDQRLSQFKDLHQGERCFVIGNGPSLRMGDLERLAGETTFSANKIYLAFSKTHWRPTYYCVEDDLVACQNWNEIDSVEGPVKFFPASMLGWCPRFQGGIYYRFVYENFFPELPKFGRDAVACLYWGSTVIYSMLQLAYYMGITEVYLIGVDFSFNLPSASPDGIQLRSEGEVNHFCPGYRRPGEKWNAPNLDLQTKTFEAAALAFRNSGRSLFNATRGGRLNVLPRVDFDQVLA